MISWLLAFFIAVLVALIATRLVMASGISDRPDEARKLHKTITPTSGGLGIIAGVFAGVSFLIWQEPNTLDPRLIGCLSVSLVGGILGLLDDIFVLGPKRKLAVMLICVTAFAVYGAHIEALILSPMIVVELGPIVGVIGTIFWLLVLVNTVNFMDGANGMAMGCSAIGLVSLCGMVILQGGGSPSSLHLAGICWIGSAACAGFLCWNLRGHVFAGDCGALFVGLLCGTLGVVVVVSGINPLSVATCFLPMLVDVILTVLVRIKRRENVLTAHAQHAYQIAIRHWPEHRAGHWAVSSRYWVYSGFCGISAIVAQQKGELAPVGIFFTMLAFLIWMYVKLHLEVRAKAKAELPH